MSDFMGINIDGIDFDSIPSDAIKLSNGLFPYMNDLAGGIAKELREVYQLKQHLVKMEYELGPGEALQLSEKYGYTGRIVDSNKSFERSVGLFDFSNAPAAVSVAMNVMSLITSQYYLHEINQNLDLIQSKIDDISQFIVTDNKNHLLSRNHYLQHIQKFIFDIRNNPVENQSVLTELQDIEIEAYSDYKTYTEELSSAINSIKSAKKQDEIKGIIDEIKYDLPLLWFALYLYASSKYIKMVI